MPTIYKCEWCGGQNPITAFEVFYAVYVCESFHIICADCHDNLKVIGLNRVIDAKTFERSKPL